MQKSTPKTLGQILEVRHGFAFLGHYFGDVGSHIVLTPGNFYDEGGFKAKGDKEKWYSGPIPQSYVLRKGDLIVAMTEQAEGLLGSSAIIPESGKYLHNQRLGLVVIRDPSLHDIRYFYYLFNSKSVRQQIRASATGTKVRHTSPTCIGDIKVCIPPVEEQRRISGILSAYDDLIENCQRRIRILEEMARNLYREWFVHFRYPGHNGNRLGGCLPEDWTVKPVKHVSEVTYGFAFKSNQFNTNGEGEKIVRIRDVAKGDSQTFSTESCSSKYSIKDGDVLVGMDGDFHMCLWAGGPALQVQRVARFDPIAPYGHYWLFWTLEQPIKELNASIVGTTVAHLGDSHIRAINVAVPPPDLVSTTNAVLEPILSQVLWLRK